MIEQLYKPFQHWAANGTIWLFSDPHFDDAQIAGAMKDRPDAAQIVDILNKRVGSCDTLICLGDVGNCEWIKKIRPKAYKVLIMGNHDDKGRAYYLQYFDEVYDGPVIISKKVILSHEPMLQFDFMFNIHGHVHCPHYKNLANEMNICIDALNKVEPINLNKMFKRGGFSATKKDIHRATIDKAIKRKKNREVNNA